MDWQSSRSHASPEGRLTMMQLRATRKAHIWISVTLTAVHHKSSFMHRGSPFSTALERAHPLWPAACTYLVHNATELSERGDHNPPSTPPDERPVTKLAGRTLLMHGAWRV